MKIGVVVHGPQIVDSGYAAELIEFLKKYGEVRARLGGTMGRTAVYDAHLEDTIDISEKRLPSESADLFAEEGADLVVLMNYGKSRVTGHGFGYKVFRRSKRKPDLIQIERPGEDDGSVVPWTESVHELAGEIARELHLELVDPDEICRELFHDEPCRDTESNGTEYRRLVGVSENENIFVNGIVVGVSTSDEVTLVAEDGVITEIIGGRIKEHGVEKLGRINLSEAVVKTGLLRRASVKPRKVKRREKEKKKFRVSFLNHAAEDIYRLHSSDLVVTVGDDTTLVAADILYRFDVPIIGITDGDIDRVVREGFRCLGSLIIEFEGGWDDIVGKKIHEELFRGRDSLETEDMESFKRDLLQIIDNIGASYTIRST
ncbi:MAG: DUF2117 domain-containing protein [Methanothermobacter wolfeii]|nr:DUF2117 domain-containing protein [Methanothermobacter wolfeii]